MAIRISLFLLFCAIIGLMLPSLTWADDDLCKPFEEDFEQIEEYFEKSLWSIAEQRIKEIIDAEPDCFRARVDLGRVYYYREQDDKALNYFQELTELNPRDHQPHHYRGLIYYDQDRTLQALVEFHLAYEADPTIGSGYFFKTISPILAESDQFLQSNIDSLVSKIPDISSVYLSHGLFYYYEERYDEALEKFRKVVSKNRDHAGGWYFAGRSYESIGEETSARNAYNQAIALDDEYSVAYFHRGMQKIRAGNWNRGCRDLRTADSLEHPGAPMAIQNFCRHRFY